MDQSEKILAKLDVMQVSITQMEKQQAIYTMQMESEKGNRKRNEDDIWKEIDSLRKEVNETSLWRSNMQGRMLVTGVLIGIASSIVAGVVLWLITK